MNFTFVYKNIDNRMLTPINQHELLGIVIKNPRYPIVYSKQAFQRPRCALGGGRYTGNQRV